MTPRDIEEYRALRATIQQRGTARVWLTLAGLAAWAGLTVATAALAELPVATLLPLLVLSATFEIIFSVHSGVERIGRYVQVFLESDSDRGWEHYAMQYGQRFGTTGIDPLFAPYFTVAAIFNFVPVLLAGPVPLEWIVVGAIHLLFIIRIVIARREASRQRAIDLARFHELKNTGHENSKARNI